VGGFVLPCLQLITWAWHASGMFLSLRFFQWTLNSLFLASVVSLACAGLSFLIIAAIRRTRQKGVAFLSLMATMGYSIPGAVVAIGVLIPVIAFDRMLLGAVNPSNEGGLLITGTILALCY